MVPPFPNESLFPKINTLRFRISILYVAIIGLILLLIQGILYVNYVNSVSQQFDTQLQLKAEQLGGAVNTFRGMLGDQRQALTLASQKALNLSIRYPQYVFMPESPEKFWLADAKKMGLDRDYLVVMDAKGEVITKSENVSGNLYGAIKKIAVLNLHKRVFSKVSFHNSVLRFIVLPYFYKYKQFYIIAVGTSYGPVEKMLGQHLFFILASSLVFLIMASLIVRIFVIRVLSSVMEISKVARNISSENMHARIKLTPADEEIEHLTGSLNSMIARLEKSFSDIKEFSMEMAHEVKTPLAIIAGESQMAMEGQHTAAEYKEMLATIGKEAKRTQRFVSDLLLMTKLDYRLIKLRFKPVDLSSFLREICERIQVISSPKGITIRQNFDHQPIYIKGDRIHLMRVFFNLIDNALKFTPRGGWIDIAARRSGQKAVVVITDNGRGIDPADLPNVFNKFYHGSANETQEAQGCGLGLSIVYAIVTLHGGSIAVQSKVGQGTSFSMEFPAI